MIGEFNLWHWYPKMLYIVIIVINIQFIFKVRNRYFKFRFILCPQDFYQLIFLFFHLWPFCQSLNTIKYSFSLFHFIVFLFFQLPTSLFNSLAFSLVSHSPSLFFFRSLSLLLFSLCIFLYDLSLGKSAFSSILLFYLDLFYSVFLTISLNFALSRSLTFFQVPS